ncbi:TPA: AIPR family protein [Photobacterium damselae subsp. damselae]
MAQSDIQARRIGKMLHNRYSQYIDQSDLNPNDPELEVKVTTRCIAAFAISHFGGALEDSYAANAVCDRHDDNGIDAIYVNHQKELMVVVQSKFDQKGAKSIAIRELLRFKASVDDLRELRFEKFNDKVKSMSQDIESAINGFDYKIVMVFAYTGRDEIAEDIKKEISQWEEALNTQVFVDDLSDRDTYSFLFEPFDMAKMTKVLKKQNTGSIDLKDVELTQYGVTTEPYKAVHGIISGDQLVEWWEQYDDVLFEKNIRSGLDERGEVNASIRKTISENPELFWYFNNGMTVLTNRIVERKRNNPAKRDGRFDFIGSSVINGAQTLTTIAKSLKTVSEDKINQIRVPIRFIEISENDQEFSNSITRANNHQNKVTGRDFASQNQQQIRIQNEIIYEDGWSYNIHRRDLNNKKANQIDMEDALTAIVCNSKEPRLLTTLKSNRGRFFDNLNGSLYKQVFNPRINGVYVINTVVASRTIEKELKQLQDNASKVDKKLNTIYTHGNYVLTALVMDSLNITPQQDQLIDLSSTSKQIGKKLESIAIQLNMYLEERYAKSYRARFFQNKEKVTEIFQNKELFV